MLQCALVESPFGGQLIKNKHLKLVNVCGNKSSVKKLTQTDKVNLLTIGGGRGQFIGFKLI